MNVYGIELMASPCTLRGWALGVGSTSHADQVTRPIFAGTAKQARPPREVLR
jgi:hypothetical protein